MVEGPIYYSGDRMRGRTLTTYAYRARHVVLMVVKYIISSMAHNVLIMHADLVQYTSIINLKKTGP